MLRHHVACVILKSLYGVGLPQSARCIRASFISYHNMVSGFVHQMSAQPEEEYCLGHRLLKFRDAKGEDLSLIYSFT
jgi:hypothetical protein